MVKSNVVMGDVIIILIETTTNIANSSITVATGIVDKKTIKIGTRKHHVNHPVDTFKKGKTIREILK